MDVIKKGGYINPSLQKPGTTPFFSTAKVGEAAQTNSLTPRLSSDIDEIFKDTAAGSILHAIGESLYGFNHRQQPAAIPINRDIQGLTFFTRPMMNMTSDNLTNVRQLVPLLTSEDSSIQRVIRVLLDPSLMTGRPTVAPIKCPLIDNNQAFIPLLTNHLLSISGWPEVAAPTMTSQAGAYKEEFSMVDGVVANYTTYDITASFRNIPGDPITLLFLVWLHYASNVYQGTLVPYPDNIINNRIDYNTRIYRLVLDSSKTFVKKIAACGASFPLNSGIADAFNAEAGVPVSTANHQISISMRCMGAMYQDDILIREFNDTVKMFNRLMADDMREANYQKIPAVALGIFNGNGYPRINEDTYELEWWIDKAVFKEMYDPVNNKRLKGGPTTSSIVPPTPKDPVSQATDALKSALQIKSPF